MLFLPITSIFVAPNRQRQDLNPEKLGELADSIQTIGLMHPIVVRTKTDGTGYQLVAGERRLRAITQLYELNQTFYFETKKVPVGEIPCVHIGELSLIAAEEAELAENLRRDDLTWQEHAAAVRRLHDLRQAQIDEYNKSKEDPAEKKPKQTVADTALELHDRADGGTYTAVRQEILIASHLADPEIGGAKSVNEAFKLLKAKEQRERNEQLASEIGKSLSASSHTILHGDCLQILNSWEGPLFDVVCTDPIYGIGADRFGNAAGKMVGISHNYDDSYETWQRTMQAFLPIVSKVCKPAAHLYMFCDIDRFHELRELVRGAGWSPFRTPLVYYKTGGGRVPLPEYGPRRSYELILYAYRGNKPVTYIYPDVVQASADKNETHGAQKPVAAFLNLLQRSCAPGDSVLDPFAGTGTVALAAHSLKCRATCIELSAEYYGIACRRVKELDK